MEKEVVSNGKAFIFKRSNEGTLTVVVDKKEEVIAQEVSKKAFLGLVEFIGNQMGKLVSEGKEVKKTPKKVSKTEKAPSKVGEPEKK